MKIYHLADLHLVSPMVFLGDKAEKRNAELYDTFIRVVKKAREDGVKVILLCGDVFDNNRPRKKDKKRFYQIIEDARDIDFLYLRGNHDTQQSYNATYPNLKTFTDEAWNSYEYGNVTIYGREITKANSKDIFAGFNPEPGRYNIVMLHGQINQGISLDNRAEIINISKIQNHDVDYVALGHYHSYHSEPLDKRGVWTYSGCLEGRGFDECGDKGFVIIDTDNRTHEFVKQAKRSVVTCTVDISDAENINDAYTKVDKALEGVDPECLVKLEICGKAKFDTANLSDRVYSKFNRYYYFKIDDDTKPYISVEEYAESNSLIGEFVRIVSSDDTLDDDIKQKIISTGLEALLK